MCAAIFMGRRIFPPRVAPLRGKSCFQSSPVRRRGCLKAGHHKEQLDLADLDAGIKELEAEAERVLPAIEEFCVSISDPRMRLIFRLRFVRCRSWAEIAGTLGRYYTEAGVCKMAYNYLKKIA